MRTSTAACNGPSVEGTDKHCKFLRGIEDPGRTQKRPVPDGRIQRTGCSEVGVSTNPFKLLMLFFLDMWTFTGL